MAKHVYPHWYKSTQRVLFVVAAVLLITFPTLYGRRRISVNALVGVLGVFFGFWLAFSLAVRYLLPSYAPETTLPIHTHAPLPPIVLHSPKPDAVPAAPAIRIHSAYDNPPNRRQHLNQHHRPTGTGDASQLEENDNDDNSIHNIRGPAVRVVRARFGGSSDDDDDDDDEEDNNNDDDREKDSVDEATRRKRIKSGGRVRGGGSSLTTTTTTTTPSPTTTTPSTTTATTTTTANVAHQAVGGSPTNGSGGNNNVVKFQTRARGYTADSTQSEVYPTFATYRQQQHPSFDAFAQRIRRAFVAATASGSSSSGGGSGRVGESATPLSVQQTGEHRLGEGEGEGGGPKGAQEEEEGRDRSNSHRTTKAGEASGDGDGSRGNSKTSSGGGGLLTVESAFDNSAHRNSNHHNSSSGGGISGGRPRSTSAASMISNLSEKMRLGSLFGRSSSPSPSTAAATAATVSSSRRGSNASLVPTTPLASSGSVPVIVTMEVGENDIAKANSRNTTMTTTGTRAEKDKAVAVVVEQDGRQTLTTMPVATASNTTAAAAAAAVVGPRISWSEDRASTTPPMDAPPRSSGSLDQDTATASSSTPLPGSSPLVTVSPENTRRLSLSTAPREPSPLAMAGNMMTHAQMPSTTSTDEEEEQGGHKGDNDEEEGNEDRSSMSLSTLASLAHDQKRDEQQPQTQTRTDRSAPSTAEDRPVDLAGLQTS
ncbi:hypothetical protein DFQ26_001681 [Actinomortierella ambigua]|nr:hypothetical protein DFQ26_001681 [Actinomortierella ambigua]